MSKGKEAAVVAAAAIAAAVADPASNVVPLTQSAGGTPPTETIGGLEKRVVEYMDSIRDLTTVQLHALAIECMEHAELHKDLRPLLAMQNHMPKSLRKVEFARWAQAFGPIEWGKVDQKTGSCDGIKMAKEGTKHFKAWNIAGAKAVAFYDTAEATKPSGITDAIKQLMSQNTKYEKLLADPSLPRKEGVTDEHLKKQIATNKAMIAAGTLAA